MEISSSIPNQKLQISAKTHRLFTKDMFAINSDLFFLRCQPQILAFCRKRPRKVFRQARPKKYDHFKATLALQHFNSFSISDIQLCISQELISIFAGILQQIKQLIRNLHLLIVSPFIQNLAISIQLKSKEFIKTQQSLASEIRQKTHFIRLRFELQRCISFVHYICVQTQQETITFQIRSLYFNQKLQNKIHFSVHHNVRILNIADFGEVVENFAKCSLNCRKEREIIQKGLFLRRSEYSNKIVVLEIGVSQLTKLWLEIKNYSQACIIQILMQNQLKAQMEKIVFGDYQVKARLPFRIVQAPFRKFTKYERDGHWNEKERLKYTVFLGFFRELLTDTERKKNARIYEMMSDMIITRNPNQCRSHHQKMEKYRTNIQDIIASVAEKYQPRVYKQIEQKYFTLIKTLLENSDKYVRIPNQNESRRPRTKKDTRSQKDQKVTLIQNNQQKGLKLLEPLLEQNQPKENKKDNIRTADSYSEEIQVRNNQEGDVPMLMMSALKEQFNEGINEQGHQAQRPYTQMNFHTEMLTEKSKHLQKPPLLSEVNAGSCLNLPFNLAVNDTSRLYYDQQLKQLEFQKQWHMHNAQHLMLQWNTEIQSIKLCEEKIRFYKETLAPKHS